MRIYVIKTRKNEPRYIVAVVAVADRELQEADSEPRGRASSEGVGVWGDDCSLLTREELLQDDRNLPALEAWETGDDTEIETEDAVLHRAGPLRADLDMLMERCSTTRRFLIQNRTVDELGDFMRHHDCDLDEEGICRADLAEGVRVSRGSPPGLAVGFLDPTG